MVQRVGRGNCNGERLRRRARGGGAREAGRRRNYLTAALFVCVYLSFKFDQEMSSPFDINLHDRTSV